MSSRWLGSGHACGHLSAQMPVLKTSSAFFLSPSGLSKHLSPGCATEEIQPNESLCGVFVSLPPHLVSLPRLATHHDRRLLRLT